MTDHAKTIRDALMWAQAYAPDRLAHRLIDAEESLRELLAGHAAEVEQLRQEVAPRGPHQLLLLGLNAERGRGPMRGPGSLGQPPEEGLASHSTRTSCRPR